MEIVHYLVPRGCGKTTFALETANLDPNSFVVLSGKGYSGGKFSLNYLNHLRGRIIDNLIIDDYSFVFENNTRGLHIFQQNLMALNPKMVTTLNTLHKPLEAYSQKTIGNLFNPTFSSNSLSDSEKEDVQYLLDLLFFGSRNHKVSFKYNLPVDKTKEWKYRKD